MSLCHNFLPPYRLIAMTLGLAGAVTATAGEPIRFSKPAVALAAPAKEQADLPELRTKRMGFSAPEMEPSVAQPPPPILRVPPRDEKRDDRHWLLRDPKIFSDPDRDSGETTSANPHSGRTASPWSNDRLGMQTPDSMRALAPVTDFNWNARESGSHQRDVFGNNPSVKGDRNDTRPRSPFGTREDSSAGSDAFRPSPLFEMFGARPKEKPNTGPSERRAAFEQLLNPSAGPAGKGPNSLEPVVGAPDTAKRSAPLALPTIGGSKLESKPTDPMTAFNQQHDRLRGPVFEGIEKKYSTPAAAPISPLDPRYQTPLNRQPTVHEFPARKF